MTNLICLLVLLIGGTSAQNGNSEGHIIICGRDVDPPWIFSGQGTDTLRLNGIPYRPKRCSPKRLYSNIKVSQQVIARSAVRNDARNLCRHVEKYEDKLECYASVFRSSDIVDSVTIQSNSLTIYWKGRATSDHMILAREPHESKSKSQIHQMAIDSFRRSINNGCLILELSGRSLIIPSGRVPQALEVIELIRGGEQISESLLSKSGLGVLTQREMENELSNSD
jgi:hypothetical protein